MASLNLGVRSKLSSFAITVKKQRILYLVIWLCLGLIKRINLVNLIIRVPLKNINFHVC